SPSTPRLSETGSSGGRPCAFRMRERACSIVSAFFSDFAPEEGPAIAASPAADARSIAACTTGGLRGGRPPGRFERTPSAISRSRALPPRGGRGWGSPLKRDRPKAVSRSPVCPVPLAPDDDPPDCVRVPPSALPARRSLLVQHARDPRVRSPGLVEDPDPAP